MTGMYSWVLGDNIRLLYTKLEEFVLKDVKRMMEDHKRDFDTLIEQINKGLTKHLKNETKCEIQKSPDLHLLESEKPIEEDDGSTRVQEHINEDIEDVQLIDETLEESVKVMEELCIAAQAHEQSLVKTQAQAMEEFQPLVLTPSAKEFEVKMAEEYYEIYPLPRLCELA